MKRIKLALLTFIGISIGTGSTYFIVMYVNGKMNFSDNHQHWGDFGAYIGGILAPAASLLAGYLIYKSFALNAYQEKLKLSRESITRLDEALEQRLSNQFFNSSLGEKYYGVPFKEIVYALSNEKVPPNKDVISAILSLTHNIAILARSIEYYIKLIDNLPNSEKDNGWLGDLERAYWIEKYSAICGRMIKIVTQEEFEKKASKPQQQSFYRIFYMRVLKEQPH